METTSNSKTSPRAASSCLDDLAHLHRGAHRHGGFFHDDLVAVHVAADVPGHLQDHGQVGGAVLVLGGAHGDEADQALLHGRGQVGGEGQAVVLDIALDIILQPRFVNGDASLLQGLHLGDVGVHANDFIAHFGKAGPGHQTHIACADYRQFH